MDEKIYDEKHRYVGRRTKDAFGNDVIRDRNDRIVARYGEDLLGNRVIRDAKGKTTGVFGQDMLGNDVVRGADGRVKQRMGCDALGNEAMLDANGRVIGYTEGGASRQYPGAYPQPDDDDRPAYTVVDGVRIYPRSRQEKELAERHGKLVFPAYASYILPALYCAAAIFVKSIPASPWLLIGLLTAGIFLSSIFGRAAAQFTFGSHAATFFISILIFFVWFVVYTTYRVSWQATEKQELTILIGGPTLFFAAELIGGLIGVGIERSIRKSVYGTK